MNSIEEGTRATMRATRMPDSIRKEAGRFQNNHRGSGFNDPRDRSDTGTSGGSFANMHDPALARLDTLFDDLEKDSQKDEGKKKSTRKSKKSTRNSKKRRPKARPFSE